MGKKENLIEQRFGYLTVLKDVGHSKHGKTMWNCKCDCGNETIVCAGNLKNGKIKSCGCYRNEMTRKRDTKHGQSKTPVYFSWKCMINRCYNPKDPGYKNYGARGIKVYRKWWKFKNFYKYMGDRSENMTLERIDNNDDYKPSNCKWASMTEQQQNKRAKGYYWNKNTQKWEAGIEANYKRIFLGSFNTPKKAHQAYLKAKKKYHIK